MTKTLTIAILVILFFNCAFTQTFEKPIEYRYKKKESGLLEFLQNNLRYPSSSLEQNSFGFSISSITITPEGNIESIGIINSIDSLIDNEVKRVLSKTSKFWLPNDTIESIQTFYIQIGYIITNWSSEVKIESPIKNKYFIEPVTVTAFLVDNSTFPIYNDSLAAICTKNIHAENYEGALENLNSLIQRDPFNIDFYSLRIFINRKMNQKHLIQQDIEKMNNFIPGTSLDELITN